MKIKAKIIIGIISLIFLSCSKNDEAIAPNEEGALDIQFDNIYAGANLVFDTNYTHSNGEIVKINKLKYIISNFVLVKSDGTEYIVPQSKSNFIVDETNVASQLIRLQNIPVGDYTGIKFGVGIDQEQWSQGLPAQGNFWTQAESAGLTWNWNPGYIFMKMEGIFYNNQTQENQQFQVHLGQISNSYNYVKSTLNFPTTEKALVRTSTTPQVKILADFSHVLDGTTKINLQDGSAIMGGSKLITVANNIKYMFQVEHVHN